MRATAQRVDPGEAHRAPPLRPRGHPASTRAKLVLSVVSFVIACVAIEAVAMAWLSFTPHSNRPFLVNLDALRAQRQPRPDLIGRREGGAATATVTLSYVDPHLGYAHDPGVLQEFAAFAGFAAYGDRRPGARRLVALGGSTTDAYCLDRNWPRQLAERLADSSTPHLVLNGGVGGYSSNQELLKLLRDVLPLDPAVVVSLNGINDVGFIHSVPRHPMVNPYQRRVLHHLARASSTGSFLFPNTVALFRGSAGQGIRGASFGTPSEVDPVEQWMRNVRLMHAASREMGVAYVCFLQPTMGVGRYHPTPREQAMLDETGDDYRETLRTFYERARRFAAETTYVVDLTDLFANESDVYGDPRHPDARGNAIIASRVFEELQGRGLLAASRR